MGLGEIIEHLRKEAATMRAAPGAFVLFTAIGLAGGWLANSAWTAERMALNDERAKFSQEQLEAVTKSISQSEPGSVSILTDDPINAEPLFRALRQGGWSVEELATPTNVPIGWGDVLLEAPDGDEGAALRAALDAAGIRYDFLATAQGETPRLWLDYAGEQN